MNVIKFCKKPLVISIIVSLILLMNTVALVYERYQLYFLLFGLAFSIIAGFFTLYLTRKIAEEKRIHKAVIRAQENERMQIGMELHDNVKQILAAVGLYLDLLNKNLDNKTEATNMIENLKSFNEQAIDELRRLSHQLAPSVDASSTLIDKINRLIKNLKLDERFIVSLRIDKLRNQLQNDVQLNLYRMLQEQLGNILKYAHAKTVEIIIESRPKGILMQIKDDGRGFDTRLRKTGIGLENIKRRAELMNGKAKIISSPGQGCVVNVEIPD